MPPSCTSRTGRPLINNKTWRDVGACNASPGNPIMLRSVKYPETAARPGTRVRTSFNVVPPNRFSSSLVSTSTIAGASDCFSRDFDAVVISMFMSSSRLNSSRPGGEVCGLWPASTDAAAAAHSKPQMARRRNDSEKGAISPRYVTALKAACPESDTEAALG